MAVSVLIFGTDDLYPQLKNFYEQAEYQGIIKIVGYARFESDGIKIYSQPQGGVGINNFAFQFAIISSRINFYQQMKILESSNVPRKNIIDGRVFQIPNFSFNKFLETGTAYGNIDTGNFELNSHTIYPQVFVNDSRNCLITLGRKSYISVRASVAGFGVVNIENFSSLAEEIQFNLHETGDHDYKRVSNFPLSSTDWNFPPEFYQHHVGKPPRTINIGSDVWIGRGCSLKCTNRDKPLIIGDGAVVASDSVVVKNVPPYAIVGGNPAKVIKYRFSEKIIESLLKIKWWNWDIDKIYDNFKYFNDIEKFVELHDKEA